MLRFLPSRTVALEAFGFEVRWYGAMYVLAFCLAYWLLPRLQKYRGFKLSSDDWLLLLILGIIGVMVGGRLGYVLFYNPLYYWRNPSDILAVWQGGMASHGGLLGVVAALWWFSRYKKIFLWALADLITVPAFLGLALGRVGNFINQELYGTVTRLPWGVAVPGVSGLRHPVQIYEAVGDLLLSFYCAWLLSKGRNAKSGNVAGIGLVIYGLVRIVLGFLREPAEDGFAWHVGRLVLLESQLLTIPVCLVGLWLWWRSRGKIELISKPHSGAAKLFVRLRHFASRFGISRYSSLSSLCLARIKSFSIRKQVLK